MSNINELIEVFGIQSARTGLKIIVKKTKSLKLGIREEEMEILGYEKINQVGSLMYLLLVKILDAL